MGGEVLFVQIPMWGNCVWILIDARIARQAGCVCKLLPNDVVATSGVARHIPKNCTISVWANDTRMMGMDSSAKPSPGGCFSTVRRCLSCAQES